MDPVFLNHARRYFRNTALAEEWQQVKAKPDCMALDPARASLAFGNDRVFLQELLRSLLE
jgi:hypothetical protein